MHVVTRYHTSECNTPKIAYSFYIFRIRLFRGAKWLLCSEDRKKERVSASMKAPRLRKWHSALRS